jgi:hypothetical protein
MMLALSPSLTAIPILASGLTFGLLVVITPVTVLAPVTNVRGI